MNLLGASQSTHRLLPGMSDLRVLMACRSMIEVLCPPLALLGSLHWKKGRKDDDIIIFYIIITMGQKI